MNAKLQAAFEATRKLDGPRFFHLTEQTEEWLTPDPVLRSVSADDAIAAIIPDLMKFAWVETSEGTFEAPVHGGTAFVHIGKYKADNVPTVLELGRR